MLFGVGIAAYPFFFLISVVFCVNERRKFSVLRKLKLTLEISALLLVISLEMNLVAGGSPWKLVDFRVFET